MAASQKLTEALCMGKVSVAYFLSYSESGYNTFLYDMKVTGGDFKELERGSLLWEEGSGTRKGSRERQIPHIFSTERIWIERMYMNVCICNIQPEGNCLWGDGVEEELGGGAEVLDRME